MFASSMPPAILLCLTVIIAMISMPAILLNIALLWTRLLGYKITIKQAGFLRITGVDVTSKKQRARIGDVVLEFHRPRYTAPYFLTLTVSNVENTEPYVDSSIQSVTIRLLVCPVQLGFTAGPWIECHFDGFRVHVFGSRNTPAWLGQMRDDIIHTIITGDTIRLNSLKSKTYISRDTSARSVAKPGDSFFAKKQDPEVTRLSQDTDKTGTSNKEMDSEDSPGDEDLGQQDDIRVRGTADQWHIFNPKNLRIYSFDSVEAELRRSWTESRGSMVMITKECRWTKVAWAHENVWATGCSRTGPSLNMLGFLLGLPTLIYLVPIAIIDVTEMVNIYISRMDVTFDDFRIRDAQALKEGLAKLRQEYVAINQRDPELIGDIAWDTFRDFVNSVSAAN